MVANVETYSKELTHGYDHVLRWVRVLMTLGVVQGMTADEAQENADTYWAERWNPVVAELRKLEAANAEHGATGSGGPQARGGPQGQGNPEPQQSCGTIADRQRQHESSSRGRRPCEPASLRTTRCSLGRLREAALRGTSASTGRRRAKPSGPSLPCFPAG